MNIPTRSEFKRAVARIEALEKELAAVKAKRQEGAAPKTARKAARQGGRVDDGPHRRHRDVVVPGRARCCAGWSTQRGADAVLAVDIAAPPATLPACATAWST